MYFSFFHFRYKVWQNKHYRPHKTQVQQNALHIKQTISLLYLSKGSPLFLNPHLHAELVGKCGAMMIRISAEYFSIINENYCLMNL